jgi:SAM-dependent methyltransferase
MAKASNMNQARWDRLANAFEDTVCDITAVDMNHQMRRLVRRVKLPRRGSRLVDLGCGIGTFVMEFGDSFAEIIAVDFAPHILARAKSRQSASILEKTRWLRMDLAQAARKIGTVADLTVCLNVITSPDEKLRDRLWTSLASVTLPKGFALIVVPSIESANMVDELPVVQKNSKRRSTPAALAAQGLLNRAGAMQKHFSRGELARILPTYGLTPRRIARAYCPWSEEGLKKPRMSAAPYPWDWACLVQRVPATKVAAPRKKKSAGAVL